MPKLRTFNGRILLPNSRVGAQPFDLQATLAKALGPGWETDVPGPTTTLTGINFASTGTVQPGAAVGTVIGTLSVTRTGATPTGLAYEIVGTAAAYVRIVGPQVQVGSASLVAGTLTFRVRASATNATAPFEADVTIGGAATGPALPAKINGLALNGAVTDGDVPLRWTADPAAMNYKIEVQDVGATSGFVAVQAGVTATSALVLGLPGPPDRDYRIRGTNAGGDGPPSDALRVAIPAVSVVQPTTPTGPLSVPFRIKALAAVPAGSPVTWFQPFASGDVPAGWQVTLASSDGSPVLIQMDQEVSWPATMADTAHNGSLRGAALSFLTPSALTKGQIATFTLGVASGTPNRTGHTSLAAVRAACAIRLDLTGLDLGADLMQIDFNEITTTFGQADNNGGFGVNPAGGWEVIRSGPVCVEWLAWRYTRRASDGATHRWQKGQIYLRQWSNGHREVTPVLSQPNSYGPSPGGTVGPASQDRVACYAELRDGATLLYAYGGPNAPNVVTGPTSMFQRNLDGGGSNYLQLPDNCDLHWDRGCAIGLSGALPNGIDAATTLYPYDWGNGPYVSFTPFRGHTNGDNQNRSSQVSFSAVPSSGTVKIMPAVATYSSCGQVLTTLDGHPVWQGGAGRPNYLVAHDEVYLTRRTKTVLPYDLTVARPARDENAPLKPFYVGSITKRMTEPDVGSDDLAVDWIGYLPVTSANLIVLPFDQVRDRAARILALQWSNYTIWTDDERSGRPVVTNNGPNGGGGTYPGLGPPNPGFRTYRGDGNVDVGSPAWGGYQTWRKGGGDIGYPGYDLSYGTLLDGSHLAEMLLVPYLRSGHHVFAAMAASTFTTHHAGFEGNRNKSFNGRNYYGLVTGVEGNNNGRARAWSLRTLGNAECIIPDKHPSRQPLRDILNDNAEYVAIQVPASPHAHLGVITDGWTACWMQAFNSMVTAMEVWRGTRPGWRTALEVWSRFTVETFADDGPVTNGGYAVYAIERIENDSPNGPWPDRAALMSQWSSKAAFQPTGYFPTGIPMYAGGRGIVEAYYTGTNAYPYMHRANLRMLERLHREGLGTFPNAEKVYDQQYNRALNFNRIEPFIPADNIDRAAMHWGIGDPATS